MSAVGVVSESQSHNGNWLTVIYNKLLYTWTDACKIKKST